MVSGQVELIHRWGAKLSFSRLPAFYIHRMAVGRENQKNKRGQTRQNMNLKRTMGSCVGLMPKSKREVNEGTAARSIYCANEVEGRVGVTAANRKQNLSGRWKSRLGWLMSCFDQVYDMRVRWFTFQICDRGAQQRGIFTQNMKLNAVWHRLWLTPTAISAIYDPARDICCYIGNRLGYQATHSLVADWIGSHWPLYASSWSNQLYQAKTKHR